MITDIEIGVDNRTWNTRGYAKDYTDTRGYVKVCFDHPLGDDGTTESILRMLAEEIKDDLERRADLRTKARMEIYKAASDICDKYNMNLRIEVSE